MLLTLVMAVALVAPAPHAESQDQDQATTAASAAPDSPQDQPAPHPSADDKKPPTPEHTGVHALFRNYVADVTHLPSVENLYWAAGGGVVALAVHPFDSSINEHLRSHYATVNRIWAPAKYLGGTAVQVGLSVGTYAFGRALDEPKVSHLGMDLIQAQLLAETIVEPLKLATHRERPDGSNYQSFPSGHAAATFAAATVLERHLGWKHSILAYALAAYVATSRLHDNVHWASDVAFGSAVGLVAGRTVTRHGRENWSFLPVSVPGGAAVVAMRQVP